MMIFHVHFNTEKNSHYFWWWAACRTCYFKTYLSFLQVSLFIDTLDTIILDFKFIYQTFTSVHRTDYPQELQVLAHKEHYQGTEF